MGILDLQALMTNSTGSQNVSIAIIDGSVYKSHPLLATENIYGIGDDSLTVCGNLSDESCFHGTYVAGVLMAIRDSSAPAICPNCKLFVRPVFFNSESTDYQRPSTTPAVLAKAILECLAAGVNIINLSLGILGVRSGLRSELDFALDLAARQNVIVVAAAGNEGTIGGTVITKHPWVIPVVASGENNKPLPTSNLGHCIGQRGLMAPGDNIVSLGGVEGYAKLSGTSVSTPIVTGMIALLWSLFPDASSGQIREAVLNISKRRKSIIPPVASAIRSYEYLVKLQTTNRYGSERKGLQS